jgi:hypothetical protein
VQITPETIPSRRSLILSRSCADATRTSGTCTSLNRAFEGSVRQHVEGESNDFLRDIWAGKTWISAGGFTRDSAIKQADERGELVAFGRYYTSNVRLVPVSFPSFLACA